MKPSRTNTIYAFFYADKVSCNANKATRSKTKKLTFSLVALKFCNSMSRATPAVPIQTFFWLRITTVLVGKILLLFHQKTALRCMLILFHLKMKQPCLDQTQKRGVSEIFKIRLKRETNLMQECSANQHQVIMPSWLPKVPSVSANQHSVILPPYVIKWI